MLALLTFPQSHDSPDSEGRTALMWAAERGHYDVAKAMIEHKVDVQAQDAHGATALHLAAYAGHAALCQLLIQVLLEVCC